jgi:hypothetical protein
MVSPTRHSETVIQAGGDVAHLARYPAPAGAHIRGKDAQFHGFTLTLVVHHADGFSGVQATFEHAHVSDHAFEGS